MPDKLYKTGEVLKRTGLSREAFYRYLNIGLIKEHSRTPGGHNLFDESVFARIELIRQFNRSGYPLRDIREIFFKDGRGDSTGKG